MDNGYFCINKEGLISTGDFNTAAGCYKENGKQIGCDSSDGSLAVVSNDGEISELLVKNREGKFFGGQTSIEQTDAHLQDLKRACEDMGLTHANRDISNDQFTKPSCPVRSLVGIVR